MSDLQATPGATAPGLSPHVTVIETAPQRPQVSITPTPTEGMSASQARAMQYVDSIKPELLKGTSNTQLLARNREALAHVFHGGPEPSWLAQPSPEQAAAAAEAGARRVDDATPSELERAFQPMAQHEVESVVNVAKVAGVPPKDAATFAHFAHDAGLPAPMANSIMKEIGRHIKERGSPMLEEGEHAEYRAAAVALFGSEEKYVEVSGRAMAFLRSLPPSAGRLLDQLAETSIVYSPHILSSLANMATARGIAK